MMKNDFATAYAVLAQTQVQFKKLANAEVSYRRALEFNQKNTEIWAKLAEVYLQMGDEAQAKTAAETALKGDPDNALAKKILLLNSPKV